MTIKVVNLEDGRPTVDAAIKQYEFEKMRAKASKTKVLKLIHGYGSSGVGGRLRTGVRSYLKKEVELNKIQGFIQGERFEIFDKDTQNALIKYSFISKDSDLNSYNNGITIVLL